MGKDNVESRYTGMPNVGDSIDVGVRGTTVVGTAICGRQRCRPRRPNFLFGPKAKECLL